MFNIISFLTKGISTAYAHVGYVVPKDKLKNLEGQNWQYLIDALTGSNIFLILIVLAVVIFLFVFIPRLRFWKTFENRVKTRLETYSDFLPWMARLSIGIALMGAGTAGVFFSPVSIAADPIPFIEIFIGFLFLVGFLLIPATFFTIVLFVLALSGNSYLVGNLDILGLLFAFLALHNERPGIDDIFNFKILYKFRFPRNFSYIFLRAGIGIAMIYLALHEKILNPLFSDAVVNEYNLQNVINVSAQMWVLSVGIIELVVGLCLLLGYYTRLVSVVAFLILSLSFFYFKEDVYSHVTLFGVLSMIFVLGGGKWSLDNLRKRKIVDNSPKQ